MNCSIYLQNSSDWFQRYMSFYYRIHVFFPFSSKSQCNLHGFQEMYFDQWMTMKLIMNEKETIYKVVKITKQHKIPICLTVHICLDWQGKFFVLFWLLFIFTATSWCTGVNVTLFNRKYVYIHVNARKWIPPKYTAGAFAYQYHSNTCTTVHWILQNTSELLFSFFNLIFIHKSFCKNYSLLIVNCI